MIRRAVKLIVLMGLLLIMPLAWAQAEGDGEGEEGGLTCPDAETFTGGIASRVCTTCYFPIVHGTTAQFGSLSGKPEDDVVPRCYCPGRAYGYPTWGDRLGMWQPTHVLELVRHPFCSPFMGGAVSSASEASAVAELTLLGGSGKGEGQNQGDLYAEELAYYNFHWITFPYSTVMNRVRDAVCVSESGSDSDVLYISEVDATWNNEELALFTHPEAVLFTSLPAIGACMVDAVASTLRKPIRALFWCAGSWGHAYPFSGLSSPQDTARATSQGAFRALAALHRRGLAKKSYVGPAVCRDHPWGTIPKQQYKLQTYYPVPETLKNHWLGQSTLTWLGGQTALPGVGEDFVYLVWTWQACCDNP